MENLGPVFPDRDVTCQNVGNSNTNASRTSRRTYLLIGGYKFLIPRTSEERKECMRRNGQTEIKTIYPGPQPRSDKERRIFRCGCRLCPSHFHARNMRSKKEMMLKNAPKNKKCAICEVTTNLQLYHIVPVSKKGDNSPRNLQWLCLRHHRIKNAQERKNNVEI